MPDKSKENISQIINDFTAWGRRIKLKVYFGEEYEDTDYSDNERNEDKWDKKPSSKTWTPQVDKIVDAYVNKVRHDVISNLRNTKHKNVSEEQASIIEEIMKDDSIIIRPSDKGSQIVILDTVDYQ